MKFQLIKAPLDSPDYLVDKWYMPVDLLSVAAAANGSNCDVEIIDGTLLPLPVILQRLDAGADLVGLSYTILSANSAGKIAEQAKGNGAFVIAGGQAATGNAAALARHPSIDAVVVGDGEPAIRFLVENFKKNKSATKEIPNIALSEGDKIHYTNTVTENLKETVFIDRTLGGLEPESYISQFPMSNTMKNIKCRRPTNLYSRRGCPRACSFCARIDKDGWRERRAELVADEIRTLISLYDVDYILDMSDTWVQRGWINSYRECFRRTLSELDFRMHVFADVRDITNETAALMAEVNIDEALLGIESGSPRVLKENGKYYTRERILAAVENLCSVGIGIYASFVIGLVGEDMESLEETRSLFYELRQFPGVRCYCNIVLPLPGSPLWRPFLQNLRTQPAWLDNPFVYDTDEVRNLFLSLQTNVDLDLLKSVRAELLSLNNLEVLEYAR